MLSRALKHSVSVSGEYRTMLTVLRDKWLNFYSLYRIFKTEQGMPWNSKLYIPRIFEVIEKLAPRMTSHNPSFTITPKKEEARDQADLLSVYLEYIWEEQGLKNKIRQLAKNQLIYGTAIAKVDWFMETKKSKVSETKTNEEGEEEEVVLTRDVVTNEMPKFEVVDIFDILIDPRDEDEDSGAGIFHKRDFVEYSELLANKDIYFNLDEVKQKLISLDYQDNDDTEQQEKHTKKGVVNNAEEVNKNKLSLKEYWGLFSPTDEPEDEEEYIITTINDSIVIRCERNEFGIRPFVAIHDARIPGEFFGVGEVEPLESLQVELNWLRNQRMDNVNLALNKMWLVDTDTDVNPSQLVSRPGGVIFKSPNSVIQPLDFPDVTSSSYAEEDRIGRDIQTISGIIDVTDRGGESGFTNTATGQRIRASEQNTRVQAKIENLEEGIRKIAKKMLILAEKFSDDSVLFREFLENGEVEFIKTTKDLFKNVTNGISIRVETGSTSADSSFDRRNDALALYNLGLSAKQAGVPVDLVKLWKDVVQKGFGFKNPSETLEKGAGGGEEIPPELAALQDETTSLLQ